MSRKKIPNINAYAFMRNSLAAREKVYSETIEDIIANYESCNRSLASVGSNRKLGNAVSALRFPAHFSCRPGVTCDVCRHCNSVDIKDYAMKQAATESGCYAMKGNQALPSAQISYWRQYRLAAEAPETYARLVTKKIAAEAMLHDSEYVRFFDTGDAFCDEVIDIIQAETVANTGLQHMLYTKQHERLNAAIEAGKINFDNTTCIISEDTGVNVKDETVNPNHLPIAIVVEDPDNENEIKAKMPEYVKNYYVCPGTEVGCENCGYICWKLQLEEGIVFGKH